MLPGLVRRRAAEAELFASSTADTPRVPVEPQQGKPLVKSKTVWSSLAILVLAVVQAWLSTTQKLAMIALLLSMTVAIGIIIYERIKKLREEAL